MGLATTLHAGLPFLLTGAPDLGGSEHKFIGWGDRQLDSGVASGQADRVYAKTITLAASANQDIDLSGALLDAIGGSAVFAKVKAIAVKAADGNTNNVVVGGAAANGFVGPFGATTHTVAVPPGGRFVIFAPVAGWTVTAATADLLRVANSGAGTSVTLDLIVIGCSS